MQVGGSGAHGPQALFLHDVPQLAQVGLGDAVVGFQVKRAEVIGFGFLQLPVEVEDGSQVHQGRGILEARRRVSSQFISTFSASSSTDICCNRRSRKMPTSYHY